MQGGEIKARNLNLRIFLTHSSEIVIMLVVLFSDNSSCKNCFLNAFLKTGLHRLT